MIKRLRFIAAFHRSPEREVGAEREVMVDIAGKRYPISSDDTYIDHMKRGFEPNMVRLFQATATGKRGFRGRSQNRKSYSSGHTAVVGPRPRWRVRRYDRFWREQIDRFSTCSSTSAHRRYATVVTRSCGLHCNVGENHRPLYFADDIRYRPEVLCALNLRGRTLRLGQRRRGLLQTPRCAGESIPREPRDSSHAGRLESFRTCP